jgi:hypothetical protein
MRRRRIKEGRRTRNGIINNKKELNPGRTKTELILHYFIHGHKAPILLFQHLDPLLQFSGLCPQQFVRSDHFPKY